jgi:hypothetical protein
MTCADLLDAIQRQMIQIFLNHDPGMQARRCQATVDDGSGSRSGSDSFASAASVLRTDVAMYKEACRFDIKLLTDVLGNLHQTVTAFRAAARLRFVPMLDAWQISRQGFTTGRFGFAAWRRWR